MSTVVVNPVVGMMDDAYFVGKGVLLEWLNSLLGLSLGKIEQTFNGAVSCQILHILFPQKINMTRVNWGARTEYEVRQNYRILLDAWNALGGTRRIEVDRLMKGRQQDNLEWMQFLKKFYDLNAHNADVENYDPDAIRRKGKNSSCRRSLASEKTLPLSKSRPAVSRTSRPSKRPSAAVGAPERERIAAAATAEVAKLEARLAMAEEASAASAEEALRLTRALEEQRTGLERERDFYFRKLRRVEIMLQQPLNARDDVKTKVLEILYAPDDDEVADEVADEDEEKETSA